MNTITKPEDAPTYVRVTYDAVVSYFKAHLSEYCPEGPTDWASRNLLWPRVFPPGHYGRAWVISTMDISDLLRVRKSNP